MSIERTPQDKKQFAADMKRIAKKLGAHECAGCGNILHDELVEWRGEVFCLDCDPTPRPRKRIDAVPCWYTETCHCCGDRLSHEVQLGPPGTTVGLAYCAWCLRAMAEASERASR